MSRVAVRQHHENGWRNGCSHAAVADLFLKKITSYGLRLTFR